jgi:hypothetical protein
MDINLNMKKTVDDKLNDIFDVQGKIVEQALVPAVVEQVKEPVSTGAPNDESIDADYEYARENLKLFIEQGKVAMENIIFLAKEGESPRAYEVVGQLIKTLSDTNKDLLDLGKKVKELKNKKDDTQQPSSQHITNALFVGSTAELQKLIGKR